MPKGSNSETIQSLRQRINTALREDVELPDHPQQLYRPAWYVLEGNGKRLRPILALLTAQAFGSAVDKAMPAALAIEIFHNFTLVHDDIMDEASERRGRLTVHERWDEGTAILVGDLLLALSYEQLDRVPKSISGTLHPPFHRTVRKLCEGQTLDLVLETRSEATVDDYLEMIDLKTGALLSLSFEIGGYVGNASHAQTSSLASAGSHIGRAFQIRDDLLDLTADDERWGKTVGGDLRAGKKTFLLLTALSRAEGNEKAWFQKIVDNGGLPGEDIPEAKSRMEALGVLDDAREAISYHTDASRGHLDVLPENDASGTLRWLLTQMQRREH